MTAQGWPRRRSNNCSSQKGPGPTALGLLRRRLQGLFGHSFQLEVRSQRGEGTTVTMRIPWRKRVGFEAPGALSSEPAELASY